RTDSFRLSQESLSEAREFIFHTHGKDFVPEIPNTYRSRKGAQEAHEAIRPTSVELVPTQMSPYLTKDQLALYSLIWKRFLASQMTPALYDETQVEISAGRAVFKASGSVLVFQGFTCLYEESPSDSDPEKGHDSPLPSLRKDQSVKLLKLDPGQHFTQPLPRYTEATLIKALEQNGIGRPSTYAAILSNINQREYVSVQKGRFQPTELGFLVSDLLVANFPDIMDTAFTARMEKRLDGIEKGELTWIKVLEQFYAAFKNSLEKAKESMKGEVGTDLKCPRCGLNLAIRSGKNGLFLSCKGYPECSFTSNYIRNERGAPALAEKKPFSEPKGEPTDKRCRECGGIMLLKTSRSGQRFLSCERYPSCTYTEPPGTGVSCPVEGCGGEIMERSSKKGTRFYGCSNYPQCHFVMWDEPYDGLCPLCNTKVMAIKRKKGYDPQVVCRKNGCKFLLPLPERSQEK
ncbi:MAG: DNA topoisomerase I, partial [Desulfobacteraceae bacterium]